MCKVLLTPELFFSIIVASAWLVSWMDKLILNYLYRYDQNTYTDALNSKNVKVEIWESDKRPLIIINSFMNIIKRPMSTWRGVHYAVAFYYLGGLSALMVFIYTFYFIC